MDEHDYVVRTAAYEAVATGDAEIVGERDGEPVFRLTDAGRERAAAIIDAAIARHGAYAPEALAEALGVDLEVGEELVASRRPEPYDEYDLADFEAWSDGDPSL